MRKQTLIFVMLALLGLPAMAGNSPSPEFTWEALDGSPHTLAEFAGHPVVLHFWASWCGPCKGEFPQLLQAAGILNSDVVFLTITGDDERAKAQSFIEKAEAGIHPANVFYAFDPKMAITADIFQTHAYPESILLDCQHRLRRKFIGTVDWGAPDTQGALKEMACTK